MSLLLLGSGSGVGQSSLNHYS